MQGREKSNSNNPCHGSAKLGFWKECNCCRRARPEYLYDKKARPGGWCLSSLPLLFHGWQMQTDVIQNMLKRLPRLRHLALPTSPNRILEAVGRHCPDLRVFQASRTLPSNPSLVLTWQAALLMHCKCSGKAIQAVLGSC